jgi:hypothetical protein
MNRTLARTSKIPLKKLRPKEKTKPPRLGELGSAGVNPFGLFETEEAPDYSTITLEDIAKMLEQDGQAQSLYRLITMPLRAAELRIKAAEGGTAEADFILNQLTAPPEHGGMRTPWSEVIENLAKAVSTGAEILEKVYDYRGGYYILDKLAHRPRSAIRIFLQNDRGEFIGIKQNLPSGEITIGKEKLIHYVVNKADNPIYGKSMFLPAYYHYEKKHKLYYIAHLAYALNAIPMRIGGYPDAAPEPDKTSFTKAIEQVGVNTSIIVPEGFSLELKDARQVSDSLPLINHHDMEMSLSILGQIINLGSNQSGGSYALGETHLNIFLLYVEALQKDIQQLLNSDLIPELIDWNFGSDKYPVVTLAPAYTDRRSVIQELLRHFGGAKQIHISPEFWVELEIAMAKALDLDINYEEIKERLVKEARGKGSLERDKLDKDVEIRKEEITVKKDAAKNKPKVKPKVKASEEMKPESKPVITNVERDSEGRITKLIQTEENK